nr:galactose oxidase early set domain-containing protein [Bradyrhizobium sp. 166]
MLAAEAEDRCYHSTALLLPDGRLFSAGGGEYLPNGQPIQPKHVHTTAQIFSPPYLFRGPRPQIEDAPPQALLGSRLTVRFSGATPSRASLVRTGSVTHAMDTNQRFVELTCEFQGQEAGITLPTDPAACPVGYYMLFLLTSDGVPSKARFVCIEQTKRAVDARAGVSHAKAAVPAGETLAAHDKRIESSAQGTRVLIGLTSRCPYGLAACWGGAHQTLKALKAVDTVKAIANAADPTAEVFLTDDRLPDMESWAATFRGMAKGSYDFRGAEVSLTGLVRLQKNQLTLSGSGWSIGLGALGASDKVQWDWSRRQPALSTPTETAAHGDLLNRVHTNGDLPQAVITGPLIKDGDGWRLHVRRID